MEQALNLDIASILGVRPINVANSAEYRNSTAQDIDEHGEYGTSTSRQ